MSSGSGSRSDFQKIPDPVSDPTFFLKKYDFAFPKMAFQNIIFKEYFNEIYLNGQIYEITSFFDGFCSCLHPFSNMDTDPDSAKVPDPCGSGSTTM
jgi:hypothetical protein